MKENIKNLIRKVIGIEDTPHKIAFGFAIGVFWGVFPTVGIGTILSIIFASLFRVNRVSAIAGSLFGLPIFSLIYTVISLVIGGLILGENWSDIMLLITEVREKGWRHIMRYGITIYSVGIIILSLLLSFIAYIFILYIVKIYKQKKK